MKFIPADRNRSISAMIVMVMLGILASPLSAKDKPPAISADGLHLIPDTKMALVYVDPDADFSGYSKIALLDAEVAFKKNWKRDQQRSSASRHRISDRDMEDIKNSVAEIFHEVVVEVFNEQGGWEIVETAGSDVLVFRPAVIDLDVTAPDLNTPGRSRTYTASAGSATLYLELYDSVTSDKLAWVMHGIADRESFASYSNSVTNRAAARRTMKRWATQLRDGLEEVKEHGLPKTE